MEDVRWPAEQLEEHRLEVSNRIRNLFWTVSGDYDIEFKPDTEKYVYPESVKLIFFITSLRKQTGVD